MPQWPFKRCLGTYCDRTRDCVHYSLAPEHSSGAIWPTLVGDQCHWYVARQDVQDDEDDSND